MVRHVMRNAALAAVALAVSASGCDEGTTAQKAALSSLIPDPVTVSLGEVTGSMVFDFTAHPLDMTRQYDLEMIIFTGGIGVTVANDETGVSYNLTEGLAVETPPDYDGEYLVSASADGKTVTITFYNWFHGDNILAGNDYSVAIDVLENEFFATETFTRNVTVN
jgi:hypothetical protein